MTGSLCCWHWYQLRLPGMPICLALLTRYLSRNIFATSSYHLSHVKMRETTALVRCLPQCPATSLSWCCRSTSSLCSSGRNQSLLHLSHYATSSPSPSMVSALPALSFSSSPNSRTCPSSQNFASIADSSCPQRLDWPSGLPICVPRR